MNFLQKTIYILSRPFVFKPRKHWKTNKDYTTGFKTASKEYYEGYHASFDTRPGRKMMWDLEQTVLHQLAEEKKPQLHLDFAGGTGRVSKTLESQVKSQVILDISEGMLAVAKQHLTKASVICTDFNQGVDQLADGSVDLVTAFRFFPNAEEALREQAMDFLVQKIAGGGWLVCNNHRNFWSLSYFFSRICLMGGDVGMKNSEMIELAEEHGLKLVKTFSLGWVPQNEDRALFSWPLTQRIEQALFNGWGRKIRLGYNTLFVFEKPL
ncbi:methyltransferase domain-containing protein [Thiomicrospira sp. R3]|uniref:methyltransferase domain-containing protein n=1 Tax=Thiomicrospira sp. R3 TaxID=3035472 RepID=UPI00259AF2D5|nr:methyltransferase domain-containing protein [Thiomicrospira sp. R3]WFE67932.1 methyltransferase domain-containing protein [Thiomicrospira sp. R3]